MIQIRRAEDRGHADHGWLDTYHSFSFADYQDRDQMGFGPIRVINEDRVAPGQGFGMHGHENMEILSYVLEGRLAHKDSTGGEGVLVADDFQFISAGSGVQHSEFNGSERDGVHFLQIWIVPTKDGGEPRYEQRNVSAEAKQGRLVLVASPSGEDGSFTIGQDVKILVGRTAASSAVTYALPPGHAAWVQVTRGPLSVNGTALQQSDGAALIDEPDLEFAGAEDAEFLLFDLG